MSSILMSTEVTNSDAERGLLSCVSISPDALAEVMESNVCEEWFTKPLHQEIWRMIKKLDVKGSVTLDLDVTMEFSSENRKSVMDILNACDSPAQYRTFFAKTKDCYRRRQVLRMSMRIQEAVGNSEFETAEQIIEVADREITALSMADEITLEDAKTVVVKTWESLKARQETGGGVDGIPSYINRLDHLTHGWHKGDVVLVAARTSVGKTAFSIELALAGLKARKRVLYFSLEMTNDQVMERMLANHSGVPITIIVDKTCNKEQEMKFHESRKWISDSKLYMDDNGSLTIGAIRAKARKMARRGLDMIIIDYAQLIRPEDAKVSREQQVAQVSKGAKALAKELKVPIIMLAQLRRSADEANRKPRLSDLRESGSLEQDCDLCLMLWRKDDDPDKTKITVAKQRNGRCGTVDVQFKPSIQKFLPNPILN